MGLRGRQEQQQPFGPAAGWQAALGDALRTEEQMKMSFMPLLYKLMYELSRSVYRATYTTAYLRADACQRLRRGCKGRSISRSLRCHTRRSPRIKAEPPRPRPLSLRVIADYLHLRSLTRERMQKEPR